MEILQRSKAMQKNGNHDNDQNDLSFDNLPLQNSQRVKTSRNVGRIKINTLCGILCVAALVLFQLHNMFLAFSKLDPNTNSSSFGPLRQRSNSALKNKTQSTQTKPVESKPFSLSPLRPIDREYYTIRINTWRRNEELLVSLDHHVRCEGVKQIQVVWCDPNDPPEELSNYPNEKVVVERHEVNSLNERFNVLYETDTRGILSIDDDLLRPCEALNAGFVQWTHNYDRIVGYDPRMIVDTDKDTWKYGYLSTTREAKRYNIVLLRSAFIHVDYLRHYMSPALDSSVKDFVTEHLNCEDIAMALFVSSLTNGKPPLLADEWAIHTMIKLYNPNGGISNSKGHKENRDVCVNSFADVLGLKKGGEAHLQTVKFGRKDHHPKKYDFEEMSKIESEYLQLKKSLDDSENKEKALVKLMVYTSQKAMKDGWITGSPQWKRRWDK